MKGLRCALGALILLCTQAVFAEAPAQGAKTQKAILVTGASSGIGRKITERLVADGHFVFAGARKDADLEALGRIENVQAVRLDVTSPQDIEAAVRTITESGRGLYGLVNNAGVGTLAPVVGSNLQEFDLVMSVNVAGPYRVTRAVGPLIIASKGRIVTIGSISGILAGANASAYSMSKHAIEAFTDSLALEMAPVGVHVGVVEPGNYNSDIARNAVERAGPNLDPSRAKLADRSIYEEPDDVAAAVALALFEPSPKRRYLVVPVEREAERTIRKQIEQLVQLNEGHRYTYERADLIKMLDEAMAGSRPRTR